MSIKQLKAASGTIKARDVDPAVSEARTAPVRHYAATERMHEAEQRVQELEQALAQAVQGGALRKLPLDQLFEAPGRRRQLTGEEYAELKASMDQIGILEPIRVRPHSDGGFEIVSGTNKTAIARELGWEDILCRITEADDVQAELEAFYANLFQHKLPAYEQYLGFKMMRKHEPQITQVEMARRSGKSESTISALMLFDGLPDEVHAKLAVNPHLLGYNAAARLGRLCAAGHAEEAVSAVVAIEKGEDQETAAQRAEQAVAVAASARKRAVSQAPATANRSKAATSSLLAGRKRYCDVTRAKGTLRLSFASEEEAELIEAAVTALLRQRAAELAAGNAQAPKSPIETFLYKTD